MVERHEGQFHQIEIGVVVPALICVPIWLAEEHAWRRRFAMKQFVRDGTAVLLVVAKAQILGQVLKPNLEPSLERGRDVWDCPDWRVRSTSA